jgi:toxin ParE1/3/4
MVYRVDIAASAEAQLEELYHWVVEQTPQRGAAWFNGLEQAILALDRHPERCPIASENLDPERPVRVLHYGRNPHVYRVYFTVDPAARAVRIVHVRHGARRRPLPNELAGE